MAGDAATGITFMQMDEGLDTGPILLQESVPILASLTAATLHDLLAECGARLILEALDAAETGTLQPQPQPEDGVTYAKKIEPADARIAWSDHADAIERKVRAFAPRPGAWFEIDGIRVKLLGAGVVAGVGEPGTVLDDHLTVACGDGAIKLLHLQREGKRALDSEAFLRGTPVAKGTRLP
jgi:methionyl-tRNA formyltransferase